MMRHTDRDGAGGERRKSWLARRVSAFRRQKRGVAAIEFALLAVPFFMLTVGALELSLMHLMRSNLGNAMQTTSRVILTGEAGCMNQAQFRRALCDNFGGISRQRCLQNTRVQLTELASFEQNIITMNPEDMNNQVYAGESGSIMMLRAHYKWKTVMPLLDNLMGGRNGNVFLLNSIAFRNEPYGDSGGC